LAVCEGGWKGLQSIKGSKNNWVGGRALFSEMPSPARFVGVRRTWWPSPNASAPWIMPGTGGVRGW